MDHSNSVLDVSTECLDTPTECLVKVMEFIGGPVEIVRWITCCKTLHKNLYPEFLVMRFKVWSKSFSNGVTLLVVTEGFRFQCENDNKIIPTWFLELTHNPLRFSVSGAEIVEEAHISHFSRKNGPLDSAGMVILTLMLNVAEISRSNTAKRLSKNPPKGVRHTLRKRLRKQLRTLNASAEIVRTTET